MDPVSAQRWLTGSDPAPVRPAVRTKEANEHSLQACVLSVSPLKGHAAVIHSEVAFWHAQARVSLAQNS